MRRIPPSKVTGHWKARSSQPSKLFLELTERTDPSRRLTERTNPSGQGPLMLKPGSSSLVVVLLYLIAIATAAAQTQATRNSDQVAKRGVQTIQLSNERIIEPGVGFTQLFRLSENGEISYKQKPYKITPPKDLDDPHPGYFKVYVLGPEGVIEKGCMVLVSDYKSDQPKFYIDQNNNLDFSDDPPSQVEIVDNQFVLTFVGRSPMARFAIRLQPFRNSKNVSQETKERYGKMFEGYRKYMGGAYADIDDWFFNQRLNTKTASVEVDGHKVMLGLHDFDCDGLYNGARDRLVVGKFQNSSISYQRADGAVMIKKGVLFMLDKTPYELVDLAADGSSIDIRKSDKRPTRLFVGSPLPDVQLKSFDGSSKSLSSLHEPGKFMVVDFWGHWCGPCVAALPKTVEFQKKWKDKVTFVAIHNGELEKARDLIEEHKISWPHFEFNDELEEKLFVDRWPTYLLVAPDGSIVKFWTTLERIEKRLGGTPK